MSPEIQEEISEDMEKHKFQIDKRKVKQAITCLRQVNDEQKQGAGKKMLFEDSDNLFLQLSLKKIPHFENKSIQKIKVHLPHSLLKENSEVCLFTEDLNWKDFKADSEPTVLHYKELLKKLKIDTVTEVIPIHQLRTEYNNFEAKRQLLAAYDVFLADSRIVGLLPKLLGKFFYKKRKYPIAIHMKPGSLKSQIDKALSSTVCFMNGHGDSITSEVAYLELEDKQIMENVITAIDVLTAKIPGGHSNINSLHLKTTKSLSLPIYMSFENPNDVQMPLLEPKEFIDDELSTLGRTVRVLSSGDIQILHNNPVTGEMVPNRVKKNRRKSKAKVIKNEIDTCVKKELEGGLESADIKAENSNKRKKRNIKKDGSEIEDSCLPSRKKKKQSLIVTEETSIGDERDEKTEEKGTSSKVAKPKRRRRGGKKKVAQIENEKQIEKTAQVKKEEVGLEVPIVKSILKKKILPGENGMPVQKKLKVFKTKKQRLRERKQLRKALFELEASGFKSILKKENSSEETGVTVQTEAKVVKTKKEALQQKAQLEKEKLELEVPSVKSILKKRNSSEEKGVTVQTKAKGSVKVIIPKQVVGFESAKLKVLTPSKRKSQNLSPINGKPTGIKSKVFKKKQPRLTAK